MTQEKMTWVSLRMPQELVEKINQHPARTFAARVRSLVEYGLLLRAKTKEAKANGQATVKVSA